MGEIDARPFKTFANVKSALGLGCWHVGFRSRSGSMNRL